MNGGYPVWQDHRSDTAVRLLPRGVGALLGVSAAQGAVLGTLGIDTILDLVASFVFGTARSVVETASQAANGEPTAGDYADAAVGELTAADLADCSPRIPRLVGDATADAMRDGLGVATVRELAVWPAYGAARRIVADAYGDGQSASDDPERPDELVPVARRYATERVHYDIIILERVLGAHRQRRRVDDARERIVRRFNAFGEVPDVGVVGALQDESVDIRQAGGIDVAGVVAATLVTQPSLEAVLTYRQSWCRP